MHTRTSKRVRFSETSIPKQIDDKLQELALVQRGGCHGLYLVHDSGASRNLLCGTSSPLLSHLTNRRPSPPGQVVVGGGRLMPYLEEGEICGITFTTVKDLNYDLYSAICAAKRGVTTIIDYEHYDRDDGGENRSYLFDKKTKQATPLIERDGMLEIPNKLQNPAKKGGVIQNPAKLPILKIL